MDNWEPCPRCGSKKVKTVGKMFWFLVLLGSGSCLLWLGFIFPLFFVVAIILIFISPLSLLIPKTNQCQDCHHSWVAKKLKQSKEEAPNNS